MSNVFKKKHKFIHTHLQLVVKCKAATISPAELVDLPGQCLIFLLFSYIADIKVTWIHNVGDHHPHGDYNKGREGEKENLRKQLRHCTEFIIGKLSTRLNRKAVVGPISCKIPFTNNVNELL